MGDARLTRLVVSEEHLSSIDGCLDRLVVEGNARFALLLDRSGQLIAARGDAQCKQMDALGALLAGNFASAREIARLIGEDTFGAVFQQGLHQHVFTALVSERWMLSVVFDSRATVGLVKVLCKRVAAQLASLYAVVARQVDSTAGEWKADPSFRLLAQHTIDLMLRDGG